MSQLQVTIRPYGTEDLPLLELLLGDPAMMQHLGGPESREAISQRHARYLAEATPHRLFTILYGSKSAAVGWVGYWESHWMDNDVWECGWHVLPAYQRRGVASAAVELMLACARTEQLHRYMHAFPAVENVSSNALCRRLGFERCGEVEIEYPKGHVMRAVDWRLDLSSDPVTPSNLRVRLPEPPPR